MENNNKNKGKKTMGRRKIEIKKIEKKASLQVTFSKRRMGLFKKASELSLLCGSEIAILAQSPAKKVFAFGSPSVEAVLHRFQGGGVGTFSPPPQFPAHYGGKSKYDEAVRKLESEKSKNTENRVVLIKWWDEPVDGMELHELEDYLEALEGLRGNVSRRLEEMDKSKSTSTRDYNDSSSSNNLLTWPKSEGDHYNCDDDDEFLNQLFNGQDVNLEGQAGLIGVMMEEALAEKESAAAAGCSFMDQSFEDFNWANIY